MVKSFESTNDLNDGRTSSDDESIAGASIATYELKITTLMMMMLLVVTTTTMTTMTITTTTVVLLVMTILKTLLKRFRL